MHELQQQPQYQDCYFELESGILSVGNEKLEREIDLNRPVPYALSLVDKTSGVSWFNQNRAAPLFNLPFLPLVEHPEIEISHRIDDDFGIGKSHLIVEVLLKYRYAHVKWDTFLYPGESFLRHCLSVKRIDWTEGDWSHSGVRTVVDDNQVITHTEQHDSMDVLPLRDLHCSWRCVGFMDRTDCNNNLLFETKGLLFIHEERVLQGNIMMLKKSLDESGLMVIKEGPTPNGYIAGVRADFEFSGTNLRVIGSGIGVEDFNSGEYIQAYATAVGVWQGDEYNSLNLLRQYHLALRALKPERDFMVMSNTWGDRSRDGRVNASFVSAELQQAKALGIGIVQIDDGWQQGTTANSIHAGGTWGDYYSNPQVVFWSVHQDRFPSGLEPVVQLARELGVALGLWFSPDSTKDFSHWKQDADTLIQLHRQYAIRYFKLDGLKIRSKYGEKNLLQMMRHVMQETGGEVAFNLDTTSEVRQGYFSATQYGSLFLENRYTDFQRYHPHLTLRNLWLLSPYIPSQKLQLEFLNVKRNQDKYLGDPLAPAQCGIAYAFAVTMFANPLAWMELTGLTEEDAVILKQVITNYRSVQSEILRGHVLPIGDEPTGTGWTGLQSILDETSGFLLIFREYTTRASAYFNLWNVDGTALTLECLMKQDGHAVLTIDGMHDRMSTVQLNDAAQCRFDLSQPLSFALYRYKVSVSTR